VCPVVTVAMRRVGAAPALWGVCRGRLQADGKADARPRAARGRRVTRRLRIHRDCVARRTAPLGHSGYDQRAPNRPDGHVDRVARADDLRGLHALPVHVYTPPKDGPGRRAARFEHACRPEPFVDPHLIHNAMIAAGVTGQPRTCAFPSNRRAKFDRSPTPRRCPRPRRSSRAPRPSMGAAADSSRARARTRDQGAKATHPASESLRWSLVRGCLEAQAQAASLVQWTSARQNRV
jgi:hypothetical protein